MDIQTLTPVRAYTALPNQNSAANREGEVRPGLIGEGDNPVYLQTLACICINQRGVWVWEPLAHLSSARWSQIRDSVAQSLETSFELIKPAKFEKIKKELKVKDEALLILKDLYEKLSRDEKLAMLKTHKNTFMGRHTCRACLILSNKLTFCVHADCTGLCNSCAEKNKDTCLACGKKQEKECPICQETKSTDDLMASSSSSCRHSVCYKCYAMAFQKGHPIWDCPLCRQEFTTVQKTHRLKASIARRITFDSDDEDNIELSESIVIDDDDDDEWEDPAGFASLGNGTPTAQAIQAARPPYRLVDPPPGGVAAAAAFTAHAVAAFSARAVASAARAAAAEVRAARAGQIALGL
jgi:hypothetical protein